MKKNVLVLLLAFLLSAPAVKADEGMWLLMLLKDQNHKEMRKQGLKLSAQQIYDINKASLKDAIVQFGRGCTGEIISDQGLLLTNHHCGYGEIQSHSSVEHDYLSDGFWAYSMDEELPNPGLTATFLVRMEDVTQTVLANVNPNMDEQTRRDAVQKSAKSIEGEAVKGTHYTSRVAEMFDGNQYILFVYEVFKDVRLVGAPPSSIGKFGADTDNWMWPRHTADFAIFRVYADANGKPAEYSPNNKPLNPKHFLPISLKGVQNNDFVMVMGFPGGTDRFLSSFGVQQAIDVYNPSVVTARTALRNVMDRSMKAEPKVRIQYASKFARLSNYWKFYTGQTKCLKDLDVFGTKQELEARFSSWLQMDPKRKAEYSGVLEDIAAAYEKINPYDYVKVFTNEAVNRGSILFAFASRLSVFEEKLRNNENVDKYINDLKIYFEGQFKDYNPETEEKLVAAGLEVFFKNVPISDQPAPFLQRAFDYKYDFNAYSSQLFKESNLVTYEKICALLDAKSTDQIVNDPIYQLSKVFTDNYKMKMEEIKTAQNSLKQAKRKYVKGIMEMDAKKAFAPDANLTIRYTYGQVKDYQPKDGVSYNYFTTLDGVIAKDDPQSWEFAIPQKLKDLYAAKDYGHYAVNGTIPVGFISNLDITGGNSGSPVINGQGELVGIAFDGNWEAMSGDIAFNPKVQRCISVDIRYVLFIIDKYAGAKNLIDEMKIIR